MTKIAYRRIAVDGIEIFYREAGRSNAPALLLLHGFPTASHMFRDLIPQLADRFHVIAPDLPGFGQSDMPERTKFSYTFDNIAGAIDRFTEVIGLDRFAIYVFDYGAPTGFRLAVRHPERITAIISQNGNAYVEGLSDGWKPIRAYWQDPSEANRTALRAFLSPETTVWQYTHGVADTSSVSPDGYSLDNFYLARPGADEVQLDLLGDAVAARRWRAGARVARALPADLHLAARTAAVACHHAAVVAALVRIESTVPAQMHFDARHARHPACVAALDDAAGRRATVTV